MKILKFPTPCCNQTSEKPNESSKGLTSDAQLVVFGCLSRSLTMIVSTKLMHLFFLFLFDVIRILNQYFTIDK